MVMDMGASVVVVVEVGSATTSVVDVVVVSPGAKVVATTTTGGTVTVACASSVGVVTALSAGQKMRGAQKAITARAAPMALSAFRTGLTWVPLLLAYLLGAIVASGG